MTHDPPVEPALPPAQPAWRKALPFVLAAVAIAAVAYSLRDADLSETLEAIRGLGARAPLVALPYFVGTVLHALAWRGLLPAAQRPSLLALLGIMLSTESMRMTLPAGPAIAESSSVLLLRERHGIPASVGVASIAAKKALVTFTHGLSVVVALALGWSMLRAASYRTWNGPWLIVFLIVSALALFAVSIGMALALLSKKTLARGARVLALLPIRPLRRWLETKRAAIEAADASLASPFERRRDLVLPGVLLLGQWMTEAVETALILALLGVDLDFIASMSTELTAVLLRSFAFVLPAGMGIQDAGYVAMFDALSGTRLATLGAAFVLVKRGKELFWIAVGYGLLPAFRAAASRRPGLPPA